MSAAAVDIDVSLLKDRRVAECVDDASGLGFRVELSCGHSVWMTVRPAAAVKCSVCMNQLIWQIRAAQSTQQLAPG